MHRSLATAARCGALAGLVASAALTACAGVDAGPDRTAPTTVVELDGSAAKQERAGREPEEREHDGDAALAWSATARAAEAAEAAVADGEHPPVAPPALSRTEQLGEPGVVEIGKWNPAIDPDAASRPVIEDVWPMKGAITGGEKVVIRGRNLDAAQVVFGVTPARVLKVTPEAITVAAPAEDAGTVFIVVTTRAGQYAMAHAPFEYFN